MKAIIFDCFGVLYLDSTLSIAEQFPSHRQALIDLNKQADYGYINRTDYVASIAQVIGESPKMIEQFIQHEHHLNLALVEKIHEYKQEYKVGMLSNIGRDWITDFFDTHQLHDLFDAVMLSGEEGIAKPNPRIFEMMAERLGERSDDCVMIDDIEANCSGADAAGMHAIQYHTNEQVISDLNQLLSP